MASSKYDYGKSTSLLWTCRWIEVDRIWFEFLYWNYKFRFELRLRYFPETIDAFIHDKPTFGFFYEQVDWLIDWFE